MRNFLGFIFLFGLILASSCRKDFSTSPSTGSLFFSKDTVYLDTVFTNIGSATYNLKVYNRSNQDITIPTIRLENGQTSNYRLSVDGLPGKSFENIDILAKDSIFIFVETTVDINSVADPLYTDRILFDQGDNEQDVDLVTLVQDATFIYPGRNPMTMEIDVLTLDGEPTEIQGRFLEDSELNFTNQKPYVIYGYAAVPDGKTLTVDAGARIHFHANSGLIVDNGATIDVNGTLDEKVTFEGDRLENVFSNIPGQWGTIWVREQGSASFLNSIIKNGLIGLLVEGSSSVINTEIYNHSNFGILAREANMNTFNVVIGSAGQSSVACTGGGDYTFSYTTFANYWNTSSRPLPAVLVNNFFSSTDDNGQEIIDPRDLIRADFSDCIIDGNQNIEFIADKVDGASFNFNMSHTLLKFNDPDDSFDEIPELDFSNANLYQNIFLNGSPNFRDPFENDFIIGEESDAIGIAAPLFIQVFDIIGVARNLTMPDAGAYEHISF